MYLNDRLGDCVAAGAAHATIVGTSATDAGGATPSDAEVVDLYSRISGYDPATGLHDSGAQILDLMRDWRHNPLARQSLDGYAKVNADEPDQVRAAINAYGPIIIGLSLPIAWSREDPWDSGSGWRYSPGSWGLHCVAVTDYDDAGLTLRTWGSRQRITWPALRRYTFEAWTCLQGLWDDQQPAPPGIDRDLLREWIRYVEA